MSTASTAFVVGQCFNSFEEFKLHLRKYEVEKRQKFTIRASRSIESSSKVLKRKINGNLKYYEVLYRCVHRSGFKPSGTGVRKSSTLRMNCQALIKLRASNCGTKLEVRRFSDFHEGHDLTEEVFEHLYHNRKKEVVDNETCIELGANEIERQHKHFSESVKRPLLKENHNVKNALKRKQDNLEEVVQLLEDTYNCNVNLLCSDVSEFIGLYFSTENMRRTMQAWPEFVTIDCTYKLNDNDCTVFLLLIEDSDGRSEIVGVWIAASEDKESLTFFLNCFKSENISVCDKIRCFMGEKDFVEKDVIEEVFPGIPIYICLFHYLKKFRREISEAKLNISKYQKEQSLEYIIKLIYAYDDSEYKEIYDEFVKAVPKTVLNYFNDNWHNIRKESAVYNMTDNFLNKTNNRLESINSKIKDVLKKSITISEFVQGFFIYLESNHYTKDHFLAKHIQKRPVSYFEENSCEHKYQMYLTHYAFEYILKQISLIRFVSISISDKDAVFLVKSSTGNIKTSVNNCQCKNYKCMILPCKHIFAVRTLKNLSKFDESICDQRWTREYYIKTHRATSKNSNTSNNRDISVHQTDQESLAHKKKRMYAVTNSLYHLGSMASSSSIFESRLRTLKEIELYWKQGIELSVIDPDNLDEQSDPDEGILQNHENVHDQEESNKADELFHEILELPSKEVSVCHLNNSLQESDIENGIEFFYCK